MSHEAIAATARLSPGAERQTITRLACEASVELNVKDARYLAQSRKLCARGTRVYVRHLPTETWEEAAVACGDVRVAG